MTSTPAVKRAPVEIWRQIFELYLGPSLLEPEESTLTGYRYLFHNETALLQDYVSMERERGILRLVCHSWNDLASTMGDRIVISHLDEHDWPPHRSREDARLVYYRQYTSYSVKNSISVYRRRIGQEIATPSSIPGPLKLDSSLPLAPMTLFTSHKLDISSVAADVEPADIHLLRLGPDADLHDIVHPIFYTIRILHLHGLYPFKNPDGIERNRTLPNLRCLTLKVDCIRHPIMHIIPLSAWHFPKLAMFRFNSSPKSPPSEDLLKFLHNHATTLEELELNPVTTRYCAKRMDWSRFLRLKLVKSLELSSIVDALPTLARRWQSTGASSVGADIADVPPRFTIVAHLPLSSPAELSAEDVIAQIQPYQWAFPHLRLEIDWKREGRIFTRGRDITGGYLAKHRYATAFLAIIDQLQLPVFDVRDAQSTDAVNGLRAFVSGGVSGSS